MDVTPIPTDEEALAIAAAIDAAWPRPTVVLDDDHGGRLRRAEVNSWRWSGRWWAARKVPADRRRP